MRHIFAIVFICVSLARAQAQPATSSSATQSAPRNVLLLISDDQGLDAGCYGSTSVHTPNIDALAAQGSRFTNAFAAVSSCSPSRSTILSGMYNHANGQYGLAQGAHNQRTRPGIATLPKVLGDSGYKTGIIGKYHLATDDVYPFQVRSGQNAGRNPKRLGEVTSEFLTAAGSQPWFLVVGFNDPHRAGSQFPAAGQKLDSTSVTLPAFLPGLPQVRQDFAEYCESVNNLDRCVGSVLHALDAAKATSNTLVVFLSDNGIPFPGAKTNLYDAGIRLPLIIRAPGVTAAGSTVSALASWVDIAPTICGWSGIPAPKSVQGKSLVPLLQNSAASVQNEIFASHTLHEIQMYYPMRAVRTPEYKLIWNLAHELTYPVSADIRKSPSWIAQTAAANPTVGGRPLDNYLHRPEFELYDLRTDPLETRNLASDASHKQTVDDLQNRLHEMMRRTRDPWFTQATGEEE
jgi:N-sulfoglucosamine sulfohydrolase